MAQKVKNSSRHQKQGSQSGSVAALHTSSGSTLCSFCNGKHSNENCEKYLKKNLNGRIAAIMDKNLCRCCLSDDHKAWMCKSKCSHCKRKLHHVSVCYKFNSEESEDEETVQESSSDEANLLNANKSNNVSVLPTARVKVKCKDGS